MEVAFKASIVDRDVQIAQQLPNARLHVAHLSAAESLKAVRRGKRSRARVTCEVTPHHFTLTDEVVGEYDTNCKMNPPLRSAADLESILVALADGTVDAIATDHAPHALHEKHMEFERAAYLRDQIRKSWAEEPKLKTVEQAREVSAAQMPFHFWEMGDAYSRYTQSDETVYAPEVLAHFAAKLERSAAPPDRRGAAAGRRRRTGAIQVSRV